MCTAPDELRVEAAASFAAQALRDRPRVLEVGCGRGDVARRLAGLGFAVTAIDAELAHPAPCPGVTFLATDYMSFTSEPFDAIVFTGALHRMVPVDAAIAHAIRLLTPKGRLFVDDFDLEAPDAETLRWYYETQELLAAAQLFPQDRIDGSPLEAPLDRWRAAHGREPKHTGAEMRTSISSRFVIRELRRVEYLYRHVAAGLPDDDRGANIATTLRATEKARIDRGLVVPVGLRIVADRAKNV